MSSHTAKTQTLVARPKWTTPTLVAFDAASAEAGTATNADSGGLS